MLCGVTGCQRCVPHEPGDRKARVINALCSEGSFTLPALFWGHGRHSESHLWPVAFGGESEVSRFIASSIASFQSPWLKHWISCQALYWAAGPLGLALRDAACLSLLPPVGEPLSHSTLAVLA